MVKTQHLTQAEYSSIHKWLKKEFGPADHCDSPTCDDTSIIFTWSLKRDGVYTRDRKMFQQLCHRCHNKQDSETRRIIGGPILQTEYIILRVWEKSWRKLKIKAAELGIGVNEALDLILTNYEKEDILSTLCSTSRRSSSLS